jgi:hypothetical protein
MRIFAVAFSILILGGVTVQAQLRRAPFSMDRIPLGLPLSEFRNLAFVNELARAQLEVICSDAPSAGRLITLRASSYDRPGALRCGIFQQSPDADPVPAKIKLFGQEVVSGFVFHKPPRGDDPRLTIATAVLPNDQFETVLALFQKIYGQPSDYELSAAGSLYGTGASNATYRWTNGVSTIRLDSLSLEFDKMSVLFAYDDILDRLPSSQPGEPVNR